MRNDDVHSPPTEEDGSVASGLATSALMASLSPRFSGVLLAPGDEGYEQARLGWTRAVDSRPALVAVAASVDDVCAAVHAAREHGVPLGVQSTGHGTVRSADHALLLKTSALNHVEVDPQLKTATVGPGAVWSDVNDAAAAFGLGSLAGRCSSVGVTGYTLGGGTGWLSRTFGYAADSVIRAEVVTADGALVVASAEENPDLFWALRGGGGNFGIVTSLQFHLYDTPTIFAGMSFHPVEHALAAFTAYQRWAMNEPDDLNSAVLVMRLPPAPSIPEELRGRRVLAIRAFYLGDAETGQRLLEPLLEAAGPRLFDGFAVRPFPQSSDAANGPDVPPVALRQYVEFFHELPPDALAHAVAAGADPSSPFAFVELRHWGGAISRPAPDAGPAGARHVPLSIMAVAPYLQHDPATVDLEVERLATGLSPYATGEAFLNLLTDPARTRDAFAADEFERLARIKRRWDPDNVFHLHHAIPPSPRERGDAATTGPIPPAHRSL